MSSFIWIDPVGGTMAKAKFVFFVPVRDNNGRPLQAEIDDLELDMTIRFVGWTFQGYVRGFYRMSDGSPSMDVSASYFVTMERSRLDELIEVLRIFVNKTTQEAIYLEVHDNIEFLFVKRGHNHDPTGN
ncbi:MAG: hypothetical protein HY289_05415 [Planctomycetes bacterium]|nr:hypothetical protein [Planctomycetota bacterium]